MPEKNRRGRSGRSKKSAAGELTARDEAQLLMEAQEELNLAWQAAAGLEAEEFGVAPAERRPAPPKEAPAPRSVKKAAEPKPSKKRR